MPKSSIESKTALFAPVDKDKRILLGSIKSNVPIDKMITTSQILFMYYLYVYECRSIIIKTKKLFEKKCLADKIVI